MTEDAEESEEDALIRRLEDENDVLRARIAALEGVIADKAVDDIPMEIAVSLTGSERVVLAALLSRERVTKDGMMAILYRDTGKDEAEIKIVDVFVCKLRRKLKPYGVQIKTLWGSGYYIDAEAREKLKKKKTSDAPPAQ